MAGSATFSTQPDAAALLAQAEHETGLHDFGDSQFRGPLDALVRFLNTADRLGADDRRAAFGQVVGVLGWRLRLVGDRRRYPGIADEQIEAPLIVIGFARSGTTLLHALLAAAPGHRAPLYREIARPSPPVSLAAPGDPRIAEGTRDIERWLVDYPGFIAQHPWAEEGSDGEYYASHRRFLQHLQFGGPRRRWVLKGV
jgi:Sulfotransferase family